MAALKRYATNVLENPTVKKFRKMKLANAIFKERVWDFAKARAALLGAGPVPNLTRLQPSPFDTELGGTTAPSGRPLRSAATHSVAGRFRPADS